MECLLRYASLFISLDACCWRYCLFPEPWLKTLKFLNSPSAQTARIFTLLSSPLISQQICTSTHQHFALTVLISGLTHFSEGRSSAPLPFRSYGVLATLRILVHFA